MTGGPSGAVRRGIQTLFDTGTATGLSDRQLLERFVAGRDTSAEAAFEVLVERHGPMVLRVCRNVLGDATEAEDAFQATFLVLVRRSGSIRRLESLGSWLYGVACRVAARARVEAARRRAVERRGALRVVPAIEPPLESDDEDFGPVIQEEVRRLPEKYRAVVALCYWQGLTQEQAATRLGCPLGTVRSRLARARTKLHLRLSRRGLAPLAGLVAAGLEAGTVEAARLELVPNNLILSAVKTSVLLAAGRAMNEVASPSVAVLTQSVLRSMFMMKIKVVIGAGVLLGVGVYGAGLAAPQAETGIARPHSRQSSAANEKKAQPALVPLTDYIVDPPDLIIVEVLDALPGRPISGERLIRPDGKISLGFYGEIYVAGLTIPEVKEKVVRHLQKILSDVALGLVTTDDQGKPKTDPKTGKTLMIDPKDSQMVFVDVTAYNSKNYYIQGEVNTPGKLAVTGKETILDAINYAGGMTAHADHQKVVLYRQPLKGGPLKALPIDIDQITMGDDLSTNYQLLPGDRLVVPREKTGHAETTAIEGAWHAKDTANQSRPALYFDRRADRPTDKPATNFERTDRDLPSHAVEARLNAVERKLDLILEALKPGKP